MSSSNLVQRRDKQYLLPWMKISRLDTKHKQNMAPEQIIHRILQNKSDVHPKDILPDIVNRMRLKGFYIKLYCVRKQSKTRWKFDHFVTEEARSELNVGTRNYALLFFYRDVDHDEERRPQIYALTTGPAWKLLKGHIDCPFPKGIGRRILDFRLKVLSSKHLLGEKISSYATYWQTESETFLSFWDCLGDITSKYQMPIKKQSSLYTLLVKDGKRAVNVEISEVCVTFHKCLSWEDMSALLIRMSQIFDGNETGETMDKDDPRFDVFDHVQLVNSKSEKQKYDDKMKTFLTESLKQSCTTSRVRLVHKDVESWVSADRFLLERTNATERLMAKWEGRPPTLKEVLEACRRYVEEKRVPHAALEQLVNDVSIRFGSTETGIFTVRGKAKLIELIEGHFPTDSGISVFRYYGTWYQINVEYLTKIEEQFSQLMEICSLKRDILPLPWLYSESKPENVDPKTIKYWIRQLNFSDNGYPLKDEIDFNDFLLDETNDVVEKQLIARLSSQQQEREYNSGYILYNRIFSQRTDVESGYLLGDNILMKTIELFDLLHYTPECTYLIHVKNGFGHSFRDVCSQIRISADFLHCYMNVTNRFNILQEFWRIATKKKATPYRQAVRRMYKNVGYNRFERMFDREICFVLAYRDNINTAKRGTFSITKCKKLTKLLGKVATESLSRNLAERDFLEKRRGKYYLTDRIFMLTADIVMDIIHVPVHNAKKVVDILKERVSKSFISKMELIQLYSYFRKFSRGANVFSLRIYSIENHNPSTLMQEPGVERSIFSGSLVSRTGDEYHQREKSNKRMHDSERSRSSGSLSSHSNAVCRQREKTNKRMHDSEPSRSSGSLSSHSSAVCRQREKSNKRMHDSEPSRSSGSLSSHSSAVCRQREKSNKRMQDSEPSRSSGSLSSHSNAVCRQREKTNKRMQDSEPSRSSGSLLSHSSAVCRQREKSNKRMHDSEPSRSSGSLSSHSSAVCRQREKSNKRTHDSERSRSSGSLSSHSSAVCRQREKSNKRMHDSEPSRSSGSLSSHSSAVCRQREKSNKRTHDSQWSRSSRSLSSRSSAEHHQRETCNTRKSDKWNSDGKWSTQLSQKRIPDRLLTNDIGSGRDVVPNSSTVAGILPLERQESVPYPKRPKMQLNYGEYGHTYLDRE
ncbi:uncharacterized protein LOC124276042 [Haliotis rubra]|uniref:uncharacterized protein LOC124276042 n=1 Tax=Haliotis rubra TaxID=36100 RepID=UPI001EE5B088|nr:uncharacterized protein LOC124276042 [Haliotis rubra]